ncbi:MAG: hypothetical protein O3B09_00950 [Proteobacteria bacterium]|nr:hypothetical protein [Pseudomonadota bacterium]
MTMLLTLTTAQAEESLEDRKLLNKFRSSLIAWHVDQRCNLLEATPRKELEWNVTEINLALSKKFAIHVIIGTQLDAEEEAYSPLFKRCDVNARDAVVVGSSVAQELNYKLTGNTYVDEGSVKNVKLKKYLAIAFTMELQNKCHFLEGTQALSHIEKQYEDVTKLMRFEYEDLDDSLQQIKRNIIRSGKCNVSGQGDFLASIKDLEVFAQELGVVVR